MLHELLCLVLVPLPKLHAQLYCPPLITARILVLAPIQAGACARIPGYHVTIYSICDWSGAGYSLRIGPRVRAQHNALYDVVTMATLSTLRIHPGLGPIRLPRPGPLTGPKLPEYKPCESRDLNTRPPLATLQNGVQGLVEPSTQNSELPLIV